MQAKLEIAHMKTKLTLLILAIVASVGTLFADKVQIGDLYYNLNETSLTAEVTQSNNHYEGIANADIPASVSYNDVQYSVTSIGSAAFYSCRSLTSVTISSSVTSIGNDAFNYCMVLPSVTIPRSVTNIGEEAFSHCDELTFISVEAGNTVYDSRDNCNAIINTTSNKLVAGCKNTVIPNTVISIGDKAFDGCSGLISIDIPSSVTSIDNYAFYQCNGLLSVTIPSSVTYIGGAVFYGCSSLTSITVAAGNTVYDSRDNCNAIIETATNTLITGCQNTVIPSNITRIEGSSFSDCIGLTSINIPSSVTDIGGGAFFGCSGLISIDIPSSVTSIGNQAFYGCSSMTFISVAAGNTVYDSRDNCNAIIETATNTLITGCQNTVIPISVTSIGHSAFGGCSGLTSIDIPSGVSSIVGSAFNGCIGLASLTISNSVRSIGDLAFSFCSNLVSITCKAASAPNMGNNVFISVNKSIPLYVPKQSVSLYQAANGWNEFTNIQAIQTQAPLFPDDPGTLTYSLELKAAIMDGDELPDYAPTGGGGYPQGTSVTITAQDIPGYEFVRWSDEVTDKSRTIVLNESMTLTALYNHSQIEIPIAANKWNFICLPPLGERQYTEEMFTYEGLTDVQWGTYNGSKRAVGQSGWETPETFNALQGYILYSTTAGTLRINAYEDDIRQGESGSAIYAGMSAYASSHLENESWNFLGNPYSQGYNIAGLAAAGIESPITVWNGVGYTTYTPGIDSYILNPFEAFFIQKAEGAEGITFSREYLER